MPDSAGQNIALTGFMAVGKSVVGRRLARRLKCRFVDLDRAIEATEGMKVRKIFSRRGEAYFRKVEKELLRRVLSRNGQVIATGGGAILDKENLSLLKSRSFLVCLTAAPETLFRRSGTGTDRPLLKGDNRLDRIEALLKQREKSYAQAHMSIDTSSLSVGEVVDRIIQVLRMKDEVCARSG